MIGKSIKDLFYCMPADRNGFYLSEFTPQNKRNNSKVERGKK